MCNNLVLNITYEWLRSWTVPLLLTVVLYDYDMNFPLASTYHTCASLRFLIVFLTPTGPPYLQIRNNMFLKHKFLCHLIFQYKHSEYMRTYFVTITFLWSTLMLYTIYRIPVWNSGMTDENRVAPYQSIQWNLYYGVLVFVHPCALYIQLLSVWAFEIHLAVNCWSKLRV
jgi:hypothetical protein